MHNRTFGCTSTKCIRVNVLHLPLVQPKIRIRVERTVNGEREARRRKARRTGCSDHLLAEDVVALLREGGLVHRVPDERSVQHGGAELLGVATIGEALDVRHQPIDHIAAYREYTRRTR